MDPKSEFDPRIISELETLKTNPVRNPEKAAIGRAAFMNEASRLSEGVSPSTKQRHNSWMNLVPSIFHIQQKEHSRMFNLLATILIAVSLIFGSGGVTVAAAQSSQPDHVLYGVKLLSEDVRLKMANNPETQYQLAMEFASRRVAEIQTILQSGNVPDEAVQTRFQNEVEQAIQFASELPTSQAILALQQIQTRLQSQDHALQQVQAHGSPKAEAALLRNRQMILEHLQWVQAGLSDPTQFKNQNHQQGKGQSGSAIPTELPTQVGTIEATPWATGTFTPGNGLMPGAIPTAIPGGPGGRH